MTDNVVTVIGELDGFAEKVIKRLVLEATANLIEATPKQTGWARANWVPNISIPVKVVSGSREAAEAGNLNVGPQNSGLANVALRYKLSDGAVYITNNVPYIVYLNEGTSDQAPKAFVQQEIASAINKVSNVHS